MPLPLHPPMRKASAADGRALAELINYAGEGIPLWFWKKLAGPGGDAWAVGAERQARRAEKGQIIVVDEGAGVMAAMTGYAIAAPEPVADGLPAMLLPVKELENAVVGAWYLDVLATYPRARGRGLGARLIRHAEAIAAHEGLAGVAIVLADQNHGALRLYERLGYHAVDRRKMVKEDWINPSTEWILIRKDLG